MPNLNFETFNVEKPQEFEAYIERLECLYETKGVEAEKKGVTLLSVVGAETYQIVRNLCAPEKPSTQDYTALVSKLKEYFKPRVNVVAERFRFHKRLQNPGESVGQYMNALRHLASSCNFGTFLDEALRDQFVCGLHSSEIQTRCLTETELTIGRAYTIAVNLEGASQGLQLLKPSQLVAKVGVHKPRTPFKPTDTENGKEYKGNKKDKFSGACSRCLSNDHKQDSCRHRSTVCNFCNGIGHLEKACFRKHPKAGPRHTKVREFKTKSSNFKQAKEDSHNQVKVDSDSRSDDSLNMYNVQSVNVSPFKTELKVSDHSVEFEIDTGAVVSIINRETWKNCGSFPLNKSGKKLHTYTGDPIPVLGSAFVIIANELNSAKIELFVADTDGANLLGRDILEVLKIDWRGVNKISQQQNKSDIDKLCKKYDEVFKKEIGLLKNHRAKLHLKEGAKPKFCKARCIPFGIKCQVEAEINRLLAEGIIEPVEISDWATPIVPILKSDGSYRICGDFKVTLNPQLHVSQYPMPNMEEIFAKLSGTKFLTKLDLSQAFNQVMLDEESQLLTVINTPWGLFKYKRLVFGIASSPAIFQRFLDTVLQGIPNVISRVDDILIATETYEKHLEILEMVLSRLKEYNLRVRNDKCEFLQKLLKFLGNIISSSGITPDPEKLRAIKDCKIPANATEVKAFCGFVNYYSPFIKDCSTILNPLYRLTQKDTKFVWNDKCQKAFDDIRDILSQNQLLAHFNAHLPIKLTCDASPIGLGVVLSNVERGVERPVRFASRSLNQAEKNYSQIEKESLAIIFGITKFHDYLFGQKFVIETDHKPLVKIFNEKSGIPTIVASRLQRWAIKLNAYHYEIKFRRGEDNTPADMLSRLPLKDTVTSSPEGERILQMRVSSLPVLPEEVSRATKKDQVLAKVLDYQRFGWPMEVSEAIKPFSNVRNELTIEKDILLKGIRVVVPNSLKERVLTQLHDTHPGISKMKGLARCHVWWPRIDQDIEMLVKNCHSCQLNATKNVDAPVHPLVWPQVPWYRVHLDYAGPFKGLYWLVVVDAHSKWPEIASVKEANSRNTILVLDQIFARFGYPQQLFSDNGSTFTSDEFRSYCESKGIKNIYSTPYHPRSNGLAERMVESFKLAIKKRSPNAEELPGAVSNFLLTYRTTVHATTNRCPFELLFKVSPKTVMHKIHPLARHSVLDKQFQEQDRSIKRDQSYYNYQVGDLVLVRDFRFNAKNKWIPGTLVARRGPLSFQVEVGDTECWRRHTDQMRRLGDGVEKPELFLDDRGTQLQKRENGNSTLFGNTPIANTPIAMERSEVKDARNIPTDEVDVQRQGKDVEDTPIGMEHQETRDQIEADSSARNSSAEADSTETPVVSETTQRYFLRTRTTSPRKYRV